MTDPQFDATAETDADLDLDFADTEPPDLMDDETGIESSDLEAPVDDLTNSFATLDPLVDELADPFAPPPVDPIEPSVAPPEPPSVDLDLTPPSPPEAPPVAAPVIYEEGTTVSQVPLTVDITTVEEITGSAAYQEWEAHTEGAADSSGGLDIDPSASAASGTMIGDVGDDNFWFRQTGDFSCGPASATQIINDFLGTGHIDDSTVAARALELELYDPTRGMTPENLATLLDNQGVPTSVEWDQDFADVEQYLREGRAVVMFLDGKDLATNEAWAARDEIEDSAADKVDHFVRVIGIDRVRGVAILADPGQETGRNLEVPLDQLQEAWDDVTHGDGSRRQMLVVSDAADPTPDSSTEIPSSAPPSIPGPTGDPEAGPAPGPEPTSAPLPGPDPIPASPPSPAAPTGEPEIRLPGTPPVTAPRIVVVSPPGPVSLPAPDGALPPAPAPVPAEPPAVALPSDDPGDDGGLFEPSLGWVLIPVTFAAGRVSAALRHR